MKRLPHGGIRTEATIKYRPIVKTNELVYSYQATQELELDLPLGFDWIQLDAHTINHFFASDTDRWRKTQYLRHFRNGCIGFLVFKGDEWASVGWVSTPNSLPPPHLSRKIVENNYWTFYVHTQEKYRGIGLQKEGLKLRVNGALQSNDGQATTIYTDTNPTNTYSRRAKIAIGFVPAGVITLRTFRIPRLTSFPIGKWDKRAVHPPIDSWSSE